MRHHRARAPIKSRTTAPGTNWCLVRCRGQPTSPTQDTPRGSGNLRVRPPRQAPPPLQHWKLLSPAKRRRATSYLTDQYPVSQRRACQVTGQAPATQRYMPRPSPEEPALIARIVVLATRCGRCGYRRITALLRAEGWRVNPKRVERLWRQEGLRVPAKQPKRGRLWLADGSLMRPGRSGRSTSGPTTSSTTAPPMGARCGSSPSWMSSPASASVSISPVGCAATTSWRGRPRSSSSAGRRRICGPTTARSSPPPRCGTGCTGWASRPSSSNGQPLGERLCGILQRQAAGRVPQSGALRHPAGSPDAHRGLEAGVQPDPPPQRPRLPPPAPETLAIRPPTPPPGQTGGSRHQLNDWYNDRGQVVSMSARRACESKCRDDILRFARHYLPTSWASR